MKLLKSLSVYTLCLFLVFAPMTSCITPLPAEQGKAMIDEIDRQVKDAILSPELAALLKRQIEDRMNPEGGGGIDWDQVMLVGGGILGAVVSSITGVRIVRGPAKPMDRSQAELLRDLLAKYRQQSEQGSLKKEDPPRPPLA